LFLSDPSPGYHEPSLALHELAFRFCENQHCTFADMDGRSCCRKHFQAMMLGVSKMVCAGDLLVEVSKRGVVFLRLSPQGVLGPAGWKSVPPWFDQRPLLVGWAREQLAEKQARADVRRWESAV